MAQIKQVGTGRKTKGTIDGITYYVRGGVTYARTTPTMPASAYNSPEAKHRQAVFKLVQMHIKHHLRTIKQTFTPKGNGTPSNRYYAVNSKPLAAALNALADQYCAGEIVTISEVEQAIANYAAANPEAITIASKSGYDVVPLNGPWPNTITLKAGSGDNTMIIIVAENGTQTTINPDGSVTTSPAAGGAGSGGGNNGGGNNPGGSEED
jgi:hypothetical protein